MMRVTVPIHPIQGCSPHVIEKTLRRTEGVADAFANPATDLATFTFDEDHTALKAILDRFNRAGFQAHASWMHFQGTQGPPADTMAVLTRLGVLHHVAGPAPAEHRLLVHPVGTDLHAIRIELEGAGHVFLGTEHLGS